ncbi:hypothetical protein [Methanosarcina sp.]|uniref:hypothetical protein n=1 Tax=Methanosarcina sp. TaxID=2213 RepID=UPI0029883A3B|nr:hypothetical protein [Methanosarcina sp.]MDW5551147.1 hypothetical protein [Methanosarcina sp.]MDW5552822.1 hypothetical protein [Methanosarcina sp.]MDW5558163.1 hypothetical protein [Methanosarcina sp.]
MKNLSLNPIGVITSLFKKGLSENPVTFGFENLSCNPIGVINRRNGCGSTVAGQRLRVNGCGPTVALKAIFSKGLE